ncbi:MAG: alpha/beta hydrolase [Actinobacteria bacterium]|nr:alpha/beta hydrolase [Actinomycetota bacterium]
MALSHTCLGEGPDVLILHGLLGSAQNWRSFARRLSAQYRVHLLDLRNHGDSPHSPSMTFTQMAQDIQAYLITKDLSQVALLGHSLGGKVAMTLADLAPSRLACLGVLDIAPVSYPDRHGAILSAMQGVDLGQDRAKIAGSLQDAGLSEVLVSFLLTNLKRRSDQGFAWQVNLPVLIQSYEQLRLAPVFRGTIKVPSLFVRALDSDYIDEEGESQIYSRFDSSSIVAIEKASHWVHVSAPDALFACLEPFLKRHLL